MTVRRVVCGCYEFDLSKHDSDELGKRAAANVMSWLGTGHRKIDGEARAYKRKSGEAGIEGVANTALDP